MTPVSDKRHSRFYIQLYAANIWSKYKICLLQPTFGNGLVKEDLWSFRSCCNERSNKLRFYLKDHQKDTHNL